MNWTTLVPVAITLLSWLLRALEDGKLDEKDLVELINRIAGQAMIPPPRH